MMSTGDMIRQLESRGYRVIPKANIGKVAASMEISTHHISQHPDEVARYVNRTLSHGIGCELQELVLKNTKHHAIEDGFDLTRFSAEIEVITS